MTGDNWDLIGHAHLNNTILLGSNKKSTNLKIKNPPIKKWNYFRFGAIQKIDYNQGDSEAFIQYESIDAAQV